MLAIARAFFVGRVGSTGVSPHLSAHGERRCWNSAFPSLTPLNFFPIVRPAIMMTVITLPCDALALSVIMPGAHWAQVVSLRVSRRNLKKCRGQEGSS